MGRIKVVGLQFVMAVSHLIGCGVISHVTSKTKMLIKAQDESSVFLFACVLNTHKKRVN